MRISDKDAKLKALEVTMGHLEKDFGAGTVMRLGDDAVQDVEAISTGSLGLDYALGVGGFLADESPRFSVLNRPVRPPWPYML